MSGRLSVWSHLNFAGTVEKNICRFSATSVSLTDEFDLPLPRESYAKLYRTMQWRRRLYLGQIGPLPIFGFAFMALFLSYVASLRARVAFPRSWRLWQVASQVYAAVPLVPQSLRPGSQRRSAMSCMNFLLRRSCLPPASIRPLVLHPALRPHLAMVRRCVHNGLQRIRCEPARRWLQEYITFAHGRQQTWRSHINAKHCFKRARAEDFLGMSAEELGSLVRLGSLRAHVGPWRLPKWPVLEDVRAQVDQSWQSWGRFHRVPLRSVRCAQKQFYQQFLVIALPEVPERWGGYMRVLCLA